MLKKFYNLGAWSLVAVSVLWLFLTVRGLVCCVWLWYFLIILTDFFCFASLENKNKTFSFLAFSHNLTMTRQNQQNKFASGENADQPGHPPMLIRVFAVRSLGN